MTVYDSLHSLLDHERLLFHCDERRTMNHCSHTELSWTTSVWRITPTYELQLFHNLQAARITVPSVILPLSREYLC
jgi:hypothetical protein